MRRTTALIAILVVVGGCGTTESGAVPMHAVPDDAQVVWGSASCQGTALNLTCELVMSDPRVSGTETIDQYRPFAGNMAGRQWILERDVIENAEGTWRGSAQGSDDGPGNPLGEARFGVVVCEQRRLGIGRLGKAFLERLGDVAVILLTRALEQ